MCPQSTSSTIKAYSLSQRWAVLLGVGDYSQTEGPVLRLLKQVEGLPNILSSWESWSRGRPVTGEKVPGSRLVLTQGFWSSLCGRRLCRVHLADHNMSVVLMNSRQVERVGKGPGRLTVYPRRLDVS